MKTLSSFLTKVALLSFFCLAVAPTALSIIAKDAKADVTAGGSAHFVEAHANSNSLLDTACNAMRLITGNVGKSFAAFAIISAGIGFFTGKISWGLMIGLAMGIAAMFGAPEIVAALSGSGAYKCQVDRGV